MPSRLSRDLTVRRLVTGVALAPVLAAGLVAGSLPAGALAPTGASSGVRTEPGAEPTALEPTTSDLALEPAAAADAVAPKIAGDELVASLERTATDDFQMVGVTWEPGPDPAGLTAEVRTRKSGTWSSWQTLDVQEAGMEPGARAGTDPMWVGDADGVAARVLSEDGSSPQDVRLTTIESPEQPQDAAIASGGGDVSLDASALSAESAAVGIRSAAAQPRIVLRSSWAPNTKYQSSCSSPTTVSAQSGALLHHTAGANSYTQAQAPGYVRAAHLYHTKTQKWCDVGYNFLVDKYGTIYEGRRGGITKMVRGAHSGQTQSNQYMVGVSMMGNYDTAALTAPLKSSVAALIAWRFSIFRTPATGTMRMDGRTINRIAGHRDVKATACPGRYGYAWLNQAGSAGLRGMVASRMGATPPPPSSAPRLSGTILATYNQYRTQLGANTSAIASAKGGYTYANFAHGRVYAKGSTGYAIFGGIDRAHRAAKGTSGFMGVPTSSVKAKRGGWYATFSGGRIYQVGSRVAYSYGRVDAKHRALKGISGRLGFPTRSVYRTKKGNYKATYQGGSISYNAKTRKYSVKYR